jgi:hypothetical protein
MLDIHTAHSAESLPEDKPDYLGLIAQLPRDLCPGQSEVPLAFWIFTDMNDPDTRVAQAALHGARIAEIIDLFNLDNFPSTLTALNVVAPAGFGFSGWEAIDDERQDGPEGNRYVAKLPYIFEVFLNNSGDIDSSIQLTLEETLKAFLESALAESES